MKYVNVESVEAGELLGKTIYSGNGTVLLSAGVQLTVFMVNTLKRIGVTMLYIQDEAYKDVDTEDILDEATKKAVINEMSVTLDSIRSGKDWSPKKVAISIDKLLNDVLNGRELLVQLTDIRTKDNAQYVHAMNVCLLSSVIGLNLGLNYVQLKDLAVGALLHDIGKVGEPPGSGSAANSSLHHTWKGFELIKSKREFNLLVAHTALQHHEHVDGTGLPRGIQGKDIHLFAKIVSAANTYDNLINGLSGRIMLPHEACEEMMAMSGTKLDRDILIEFNRSVSVYPNGTAVRLSTKETGVIVRQHRGLPGRPVIRVARGSTRYDLDVIEVDLAQHTTVFIEAVLM
ncbi:HD domain-containing phosphohydrolase [Paenibacillus taichungensis]|uniref:HD domain-containing protein n=1 Tax=Paenibacillus taichungensis TaxID=484184 RepID=A0ABX2MNC1_9BACL|nr:HD domain-containing phosphohydrolase [Paenibacillus taichungensis]MEC0105546.1 HD domain-containing phosphohydrolase [Paenibacillus taichungensis]MEC0198038.1 HD domain-containing phosphohydrolase [Paenibacillus taichungensis]NUU55520.1 HD domain-containing protein [Paenibacillus taichungensis]OME79669.1 metal-dependent phosphohydrolase [Paenibacillus pabuli]